MTLQSLEKNQYHMRHDIVTATEPNYHRELASKQERRIFGGLLLIFSIVAIIYVMYLLYKRWKRNREFSRMEETRAHADVVLGDIVMDGMDDSSMEGDQEENENEFI
mmetsp:Transcript_11346/g.15725  ORF Transcript_11346/g.15725 Transcript_11346/m.15725 type:complete len:107 (-) Transcript_11346:575-895(-)